MMWYGMVGRVHRDLTYFHTTLFSFILYVETDADHISP